MIHIAKHNDKEFQDTLRQSFRDRLRQQLVNGLSQGMYAACQIILDRINNEEHSAEEKLEAIREFCEVTVTKGHATAPAAPSSAPQKEDGE